MKSKKMRWGITLGVSLLVLVSALVFTDVADAKTKVNIQAEKSRYFKKQGLYIIEGNPFIKYKDYTISADLIKYYEDDDRAIFTGNVVVLQDETRIHADAMEAELKDESFIIDGNVDIYYVREKKEADETVAEADAVGEEETAEDEATSTDDEGKNDVIKIRAQHVIFTQLNDADHLVAKRDVVMDVDDQVITSEYLEYQGDKEMVLAREDVRVVGADEEELFTNEFTYWLEGEEEGFEATGGVKLEFFMDEDEEDDADATLEVEADVENVDAENADADASAEGAADETDLTSDETTEEATSDEPVEEQASETATTSDSANE